MGVSGQTCRLGTGYEVCRVAIEIAIMLLALPLAAHVLVAVATHEIVGLWRRRP